MTNWLQKPKDWCNGAANVFRSVGPFLISQSDRASEAFVRHQGRMATIEAMKTVVEREAESLSVVRDLLRKKYIEATDEERVRIRRDIADSDADIRQLQTAALALGYLSDSTSDSNDTGPRILDASPFDEPREIVSEHWMDKFNQLARSRNEPWRQNLLARALAVESATPGSINARALWLIGTLEESKFKAFATVLDISSKIDGGYIIPGDAVANRIMPQCELGDDLPIGALVFELGDTGLIADLNSQRTLYKGETFYAAYHENYVFEVQVIDADSAIKGVLPSTIGDAIATFYERRPNQFGLTLFNEWLQSLRLGAFSIVKHLHDGSTITCTKGNPQES